MVRQAANLNNNNLHWFHNNNNDRGVSLQYLYPTIPRDCLLDSQLPNRLDLHGVLRIVSQDPAYVLLRREGLGDKERPRPVSSEELLRRLCGRFPIRVI